MAQAAVFLKSNSIPLKDLTGYPILAHEILFAMFIKLMDTPVSLSTNPPRLGHMLWSEYENQKNQQGGWQGGCWK